MDTLEHVKALVPAFKHDDEGKRQYLSWRICGFTPGEALIYSKVDPMKLSSWLTDKEFVHVEVTQMDKLRKTAVESVLTQEFLRNMRRVQALDTSVLHKALTSKGLDALDDASLNYLLKIRGQYDPRVRKTLGLDGGIPQDWTEAVLMIRRDSGGTKELTSQEGVIESEYQESSTE